MIRNAPCSPLLPPDSPREAARQHTDSDTVPSTGTTRPLPTERPFCCPAATSATMTIHLYDTTLRDGTQREGLSLSVEDKLKIARVLDRLGVSYIEGGWPGSNPKDADFFRPDSRGPARPCADRGLWQHASSGHLVRRRRQSPRPARRRDSRRHHRGQELDPARGSRAARPTGTRTSG